MSTNNKSLLFLVGLLPAMHVILMVGLLIRGIVEKDLSIIFTLLFVAYILPPLMWRLLNPLIPTQMGTSFLGAHTETVNGWFVSYQIQQIYNALPFLENSLKLIPGLYSSWLRLWGARIGDDVSWTLQSKIIDRPFIHIGDRCHVGQSAILSAHTINKKGELYHLHLKEIIIESDLRI
ncbi:MAG: hypothetical protein Q7U04_13530 [Bacteriovorax sp.]|nr:hypothetical protein [Bacteriovorax sp.]